jgi:hypothetical protein
MERGMDRNDRDFASNPSFASILSEPATLR